MKNIYTRVEENRNAIFFRSSTSRSFVECWRQRLWPNANFCSFEDGGSGVIVNGHKTPEEPREKAHKLVKKSQ